MDKSKDDCYFYFYSTCKKGALCPFRHCKAALGTEMVCPNWQYGKCFDDSCSLRHMENNKDRSAIPCYWENQPGGCRKPHCVFKHYRGKGEEAANLVTASEKQVLTSAPRLLEHVYQSASGGTASGEMQVSRHVSLNAEQVVEDEVAEELQEDSIVLPEVEPLVVNFDEESDTESCTSSTNRPLHVLEREIMMREASFPNDVNRTVLTTRGLASKTVHNQDEGVLDLGIKTLQELRREREHKDEVEQKSADSPTSPNSSETKARKKLRLRLQTKTPNELDFKIKTLEEIRQEKLQGSAAKKSESSSPETKENNRVAEEAEKSPNNSEAENAESKKGAKRKRSKWSIYQPPKLQKSEKQQGRLLSPMKITSENKRHDTVHIKTLAEIREERLKVQYNATSENKASGKQPSPPRGGLKSNVQPGSPKRVADVSALAPFLSKRIRLSSAVNKGNLLNQDARAARFAPLGLSSSSLSTPASRPAVSSSPEPSSPYKSSIDPEAEATSENTAAPKGPVEKPTNATHEHSIPNPTPNAVSNHVQSNSSETTKEAAIDTSDKKELPSPKESSVSTFVANSKPEARLSETMDDDLDLLLGSDDEAEEDNSDVKADDLLRELEQMINS